MFCDQLFWELNLVIIGVIQVSELLLGGLLYVEFQLLFEIVTGVGHLDFEKVVLSTLNLEVERDAHLLLWSHFLYYRFVHHFVCF